MKPRKRVYISGPITLGDREHNFRQSAEAQVKLMAAGLAPLNPMLTMKLPGAFAISHDVWMSVDLPWVECADAILRLPGTSRGADVEILHAMNCGIPIFHDIDELIEDIR